MDCCNYQEYTGMRHNAYGYGGYGFGRASHGYNPYAAPVQHQHYPTYGDYYSTQHYNRYPPYSYDYQRHSSIHRSMPTDYGNISKDVRAHRAMLRREAERARAAPLTHLNTQSHHTDYINGVLHTQGFCNYQQPMNNARWSHYQMNGGSACDMWDSYDRRSTMSNSIDPLRGLTAMHDACSTSNNENTSMNHIENHHTNIGPRGYNQVSEENNTRTTNGTTQTHRQRVKVEPKKPFEMMRHAPVPLPAFSQAFGSTEIGKFADVFNRPDDLTEEMVREAIAAHMDDDLFLEWNDGTLSADESTI